MANETKAWNGRDRLGLDCPLNAQPSRYWPYDNKTRLKFPSAVQDWAGVPRTLRERKMMAFMGQITEKPEWPRKIHDKEIVGKWKDEAAELAKATKPEETLTEKMVDYCIEEMKDYAKSLEKDGFLPGIRATAVVLKSDSIIGEDLKDALREAVAPLENVPDKQKDWHPKSKQQVLDLVHPSLFPLMYGKSRILREGTVPLEHCERSIGKGEIMPVPEDAHLKPGCLAGFFDTDLKNQRFYSGKFQWLPCEVAFSQNDEVKITSYINNLHPRGNEKLYGVIEKILARAIPMWDATLASTDRRKYPFIRVPVREPYYNDPEGERPKLDGEERRRSFDSWDMDREWHRANRTLIFPEPVAYEPILDVRKRIDNQPYSTPQLFDRPPSKKHPQPKTGLRQIFAEQGLQVIVKLANIHLTPEKPSYPGGSWHIEGQLNEHICASALYYYDSENITDSSLSLREMVTVYDDLDYEQGDYEHLEILYGIQNTDPALQNLGSVQTPEGRLLTFPNVLQHRVSPFSLADTSKPGHRKILALFLVDPYVRIPSTAHVPPQQRDWWRGLVHGMDEMGKLPVELVDRIVDGVEDWPMGLEEAKGVRVELMEERKAFERDWEQRLEEECFSFCEH